MILTSLFRRAILIASSALLFTAPAWGGHTNNILLTGYWPPTNEAVRHFSANPDQNPAGWVGENWEGRGYDVYSFFPEFPDFANDRRGEGDFEVDYQDTSEDWWRITAEVEPVAIITFSAGTNGLWELETRQRNLARSQWVRDFDAPFRPTPSPPDDSVPVGTVRPSTLPVQEIADAVAAADIPGVEAFIDTETAGGAYLSEYIAYHGVWYQDLHSDPNDDAWSVAAGHIHVGPDIPVSDARLAAEISLRTLLDHVDSILVPEPSGFGLIVCASFGLVFLRRQGEVLS